MNNALTLLVAVLLATLQFSNSARPAAPASADTSPAAMMARIEGAQVPDILQLPDITLHVGLDVGANPEIPFSGKEGRLRVATVPNGGFQLRSTGFRFQRAERQKFEDGNAPGQRLPGNLPTRRIDVPADGCIIVLLLDTDAMTGTSSCLSGSREARATDCKPGQPAGSENHPRA